MIAGAIERGRKDGSKTYLAEFKAIQWRLVDKDGRSVNLQTVGGVPYQPAWCHADDGIVFDGRDNEDMKLRFYSSAMRVPLFIQVLPQKP